jgi:hypothetical protein
MNEGMREEMSGGMREGGTACEFTQGPEPGRMGWWECPEVQVSPLVSARTLPGSNHAPLANVECLDVTPMALTSSGYGAPPLSFCGILHEFNFFRGQAVERI